MKYVLTIFVLIMVFCSCEQKMPETSLQRFSLISSQHSGIEFQNNLILTDSINIYTFRNFYNGAGVGCGDFNNDGLLDLYFAGNQENNELYLNKGNFEFENITEQAGVASHNVWSTGISVIDINGDGWLDIYVCKSGENKGDNRHNELFINNGATTSQGPAQPISFTERSEEFGLADLGLSTHAAFFDYDKDGDLDCYLLNNSYRTVGGYDLIPDQRNIRDKDGGNKLYRNEMAQGRNHFTDVSEEAGIYGSAIGFGLGVAISDLNGDSWPDIFVSNDFFEKDYMYINNGDGTFSESIEKNAREISMGSMGADIADLNNDAKPEIFVTEMLPRSYERYKTKVMFEDWNKYNLNIKKGYFRQFARNVLQLNRGGGLFSEISRFAEVDATEWSWGALIADFDANGYQDIFVANGIYKDLLDQDYINFFSDARQVRQILHDSTKGILNLIDYIPSEPIANCLFANNGDLRLTEEAHGWGLGLKGFSNGAAYGDLDNDGDLDLVVNNINDAPFILQNNTGHFNYVSFILLGEKFNTQAIGSQIFVHCGEDVFYRELYPQRGFMSSVDPIINIGLGDQQKIDSIIIEWPSNNAITRLVDVNVNQVIKLNQKDHQLTRPKKLKDHTPFLTKLQNIIDFEHSEPEYSDFDKESLVLAMNSREGPACCSGDINNDGLEDFYIGGASGQKGKLYVQLKNGSFRSREIPSDESSEETDCIFFNADDDEYLDLYVASGSSEFGGVNTALIDRIYFNKNGSFKMSEQILPTYKFENTSSVYHFDFDLDGDQDLLVGIHIVPFRYGLPGTSYLLENDGKGNFNKSDIVPDLEEIGMISDVSTGDFDQDGDVDMLLVGQWMSPKFLENTGGTFKLKEGFLKNLSGFWTLAETKDVDADGDLDIILGNLGENNQLRLDSLRPARLYINDFDRNGKIEQILCIKDQDRYIPYHTRIELIKQMPLLGKSIPNYKSYAALGIEDIIPIDILTQSLILQVNERRSGILINESNWNFSFKPFPDEAQLSSIYTCEVMDLNADGISDLLLGGNQYNWIPRLGGQDGIYGVCLLGLGGGNYIPISHEESGFLERGEIRRLLSLGNKVIVAKNNMKASLYELN